MNKKNHDILNKSKYEQTSFLIFISKSSYHHTSQYITTLTNIHNKKALSQQQIKTKVHLTTKAKNKSARTTLQTLNIKVSASSPQRNYI